MNDQNTQPTSGTSDATPPIAIVKKPSVTRFLGDVAVPDEVDLKGVPKENNTRWVFDICIRNGEPIEVQLLKPRSGKPLEPDIMSFTITPMSKNAHKAHPWGVPDEAQGTLTIYSQKTEEDAEFCIAVDVMHSAHR